MMQAIERRTFAQLNAVKVLFVLRHYVSDNGGAFLVSLDLTLIPRLVAS